MSMSAARALFKAFHGREAAPGEIGTLRAKPKRGARLAGEGEEVLTVGRLNGLIYEASGDGKQYVHHFKKDARPVLAVTHDGKQAYILAGGYKFTSRGFEDRTPNRRTK